MTEALKPCPFCGLPARRLNDDDGEKRVGCSDMSNCCLGPVAEGATIEDAARVWNARAPDPRIAAAKALAEACGEVLAQYADGIWAEGRIPNDDEGLRIITVDDLRRIRDARAARGMCEDCNCWRCQNERHGTRYYMPGCSLCGNKRCPRASDHRNQCTASNRAGQPGSYYATEHGSGEPEPPMDERLRMRGAI